MFHGQDSVPRGPGADRLQHPQACDPEQPVNRASSIIKSLLETKYRFEATKKISEQKLWGMLKQLVEQREEEQREEDGGIAIAPSELQGFSCQYMRLHRECES